MILIFSIPFHRYNLRYMKILLLIIVIIIGLGFYVFSRNENKGEMAGVRDIDITIEIADTPDERAKGLSGRESLDKSTGLLFIHDKPGIYGIWMKDMKFPIDVIWLDGNYRVVDIASDVQSDSFPEVFEPRAPALYILEVNAGFTEKNGIRIGGMIEFLQ